MMDGRIKGLNNEWGQRERERERERENKIQLWHVHVTNRDQHPSPYAARELRVHCSGRLSKADISLHTTKLKFKKPASLP